MRKIKFRAWSAVKKEWVENMLLLACIDGLPFAHFVEVDTETNTTKHHVFNASGLDLTIQQHTGIKDKNGIDIYEGDILKHNIGLGPVYWEVVWDAKAAAWKTTKEHGGNSGDWFDYYEVAGNIFENPELLKS